MILLVVNFHYVASERPAVPRAIFPVTTKELAERVELLGRTFEFVSRDAVIAAVVDGRGLPERACLVTFDDGLRAQFELALPVLVERGIPALFLVPGRPLAERRGLYVHKIHHLRERLDDGELLRLLAQDGRLASVEPVAAERHYPYDSPEAARVKYLLNVALPLPERERAVAGAFGAVCPDEGAFCDELYMSAEQVRELEANHEAVGSHGYGHQPLALLDPAALRRDLARTVETLERVTGSRPRAISYPHGSREAVSPEVADAAAELGFVAGFTMERAFNRTLVQPLLLARIDVNDAPGGTRPLFELAADEPRPGDGMSSARRRYFAEAG